jgi:tetratricopeptide (TPR) repeat protein
MAHGKSSVHENLVPLEQRQRLSRSLLWKLQRNYFKREGMGAWSTGTVPHHISSSPFIADAYNRVVFAFLRDCQVWARKQSRGALTLDPRRPIYIIELGSGHGRFAYLFLKKFLVRQRDSDLKTISVKYVMTDFAERTLESWRAQTAFQPFLEQGLLDFARFDVERDQKLKLLHSGETISARNSRNPLIVIANYLFDSIPPDAFFVSGGELFETLVTLSTLKKEIDPNDPEILSRIELWYDYNRVNGKYYKDAKCNRILLDYKKRLPDTAFLFPTATLQCVRNLHRLSRGRMLLLSGDRGYSSDEALIEGKGAPGMAVHGSISMMVDYQIIGEYCRLLGGQVLHPAHHSESFNISAFMFGNSPTNFFETRQVYAEAIEKFGPADFFALKEGIGPVVDSFSLEQIISFLRLSCWDYKRFRDCLPALKKHLAHISDVQKRELYEAILKVWDSYLPIGEEDDLAFEMGTLLLEMQFHKEALEFLQCSVDRYGIAPGSAYNIALCYYGLSQIDRALDFVNQALGLDREFVEAKTLRTQLESARAI